MPKMANAPEIIERLARESERQSILRMAQEAESLDELIKTLKSMLDA